MIAGRFVSAVGGIVLRGDDVLLVKHNYGPTKGRWDFPRGRVEMDETMEQAVVRELAEETSIAAKPVRIVALREQIGVDRNSVPIHEVLAVWLLWHVANDPIPDGSELSEAVYMRISDALSSPHVSTWAKEMIRVAQESSGLHKSSYLPSSLPDSVQSWKLYVV